MATNKTFLAPNGLELAQLNKAETEFLYKEIFVDRVYFRHGIQVRDGDCVFDIGANIGMFSVYLQEQFKNVKVFAFEPSPEIFAVLSRNVARYAGNVTPMPVGIAGHTRKATFSFYPSYSILSGFHGDQAGDSNTIRSGVLAQWRERYPDRPDPDDRFLDALADGALKGKVEYDCQLRALSEVIDETKVEKISLLKIDAEGSELEILSNIAPRHWRLIQQIAIEIHGTRPSDADAIRAILDQQKFTYVMEEEKHLQSSGIVNCFARRA